MKIKIPGIFLTKPEMGKPKVRWLTIILLAVLIIVAIIFLNNYWLTQTIIIGHVAFKKAYVNEELGYWVPDIVSTTYKVARENPGVKKIILRVYLVTKWKENGKIDKETFIGEITVPDASDVRKYNTLFAYRDKTINFFRDAIRAIDTQELIEYYENKNRNRGAD